MLEHFNFISSYYGQIASTLSQSRSSCHVKLVLVLSTYFVGSSLQIRIHANAFALLFVLHTVLWDLL